jgi:hypothetical protein
MAIGTGPERAVPRRSTKTSYPEGIRFSVSFQLMMDVTVAVDDPYLSDMPAKIGGGILATMSLL